MRRDKEFEWAPFGSADDVHAVKEALGLFALQHAALNFLVDFTLRSSTLLILIHDVEEKWDDEVENFLWRSNERENSHCYAIDFYKKVFDTV
ncbi:hypothetical protein NC653_023640 [Populus alba x Populus x berolinensis]|uniref:Uncharacterized protein n=1 Tax=Populus alba x Populus x berolinensis TaxID=444605 RepID=A0AAD6QAW9_9ROSI|nr:hypothetical protein NC653_023640 [Populus alba x Populus x berolinensis]